MTDQSNLTTRGQEAEVNGLAPQRTIDMTAYGSSNIPNQWEIDEVTGDILMVEYADVEKGEGGDEYIKRGGILVSAEVSHHVWRVGKIAKAGPGASSQAKVGAYVMFPNDKGIPCTKFADKDYIFINEERIFAYVKPREDKQSDG